MFPNKCLVGLHMRANGGNEVADFEAARVAKIEAAKMMTTHPPEDVDRLKQIGVGFFICRIYEDLNNRNVSPSEFVRWQIAPDTATRRMYAKGIRLFEIHNEPNLKQEGMRLNSNGSWSNGKEFGDWFIEVIRQLKLAFPDALFGFPGVSPGWAIPGIRAESNQFLREAVHAMREADWLGAHAYEVGSDSLGAGGAWRVVRDMVNKPVAITEFSSPNQDRATQARQYREFYERIRSERNVFGAFSFVVSGTYFQHEGWRLENGHQLTAIPYEVAKRKFISEQPRPEMPQEPLYYAYVNGSIIANVRNYEGNKVTQVKRPGDKLPVYGILSKIGVPPNDWEDRAVINRDTLENIWNVRIDKEQTGVEDLINPQTGWGWPVYGVKKPYYTQKFDNPTSYGKHEGVDIRIIDSPTRQIVSVFDGEVIYVHEWNGTLNGIEAYGNFVVVRQDDGYDVWYCHMERTAINVGVRVQRGTNLGIGGYTGNSKTSEGLPAPHLHFQVLDPNSTKRDYVFRLPAVNPTPLLPKI